MMIPNIILFHEIHRKRALVPKVDFISAPGSSAPNVHRPGGPAALVTGMGCFTFERVAARFRLDSIHPGQRLEDILGETGFSFDHGPATPPTRVRVTSSGVAFTSASYGDDVLPRSRNRSA